MNLQEIVEKYIKVRDKRSLLKAERDRELAKFDELQDKLEALLLAKFQELGVESIRTEAGTAYASLRTSVSAADPDAFFTFIRETESFDLLERRPSKTAIEQYRESTGELPPGINWSQTRVVNFRKS